MYFMTYRGRHAKNYVVLTSSIYKIVKSGNNEMQMEMICAFTCKNYRFFVFPSTLRELRSNLILTMPCNPFDEEAF